MHKMHRGLYLRICRSYVPVQMQDTYHLRLGQVYQLERRQR